MNQMIKPIYRSMLGAFVGDAAGATLEFGRRPVTKGAAEEAMRMPGGGVMGVGPGQITDDGELTLALWSAIRPWDSYFGIPRTNMVRAYAAWYKSRPFDCGNTCGYAFSEAAAVVDATEEGKSLNYDKMREFEQNVKENNAESEANGALMRATALATWIAGHPETPITHCIGLAETDAELSHPSEVCCEVNKIYVLAICMMLRGETPETTLRYISDFVEEHIQNEKVKHWFFEDSRDISALTCERNIGHVRWAFTLAMYFLRNPGIGYEEAIRTTLMKGGDTDTNACIVGGLVACYQPIPDYMLGPVLAFDCTKDDIQRPEAYSVKKWFG
jgi:ADP-ribosyl-[dinitrogen reductase] hydrolase